MQREITTDIEEIQRLMEAYFKNMRSMKLEKIKKMYGFLDMYNLTKIKTS